MSKAVYVFKHMPDSCEGCFKIYRNGACILADGDRWVEEPSKRPDWCPLKEVPSYVPDRARPYAYTDDEAVAYNDGWNDCLEEIMGDDKDE